MTNYTRAHFADRGRLDRSIDYFTKHGAQILADRINAFWRARGVDAKAYAGYYVIEGHNPNMDGYYVVRSALKMGVPNEFGNR